MKKILSFIFLLFIPFVVNAEVKITSAEVVDQTKDLDVEKNPDFKGLKLDIDIKFANKDEFVKYKLVLKNDTKKDYEVEVGETFGEGEYIKYLAEYAGNNSVLKAGEEKEIFVTVSYDKEVPITAFKNGKYTETKAVAINLSHEEKQVNPDTKVGYYILATAVILFISLLLIIFNKYKLEHLMVLVIAIAVALPISIFALEKITVEVDANIEIEEPKTTYTLVYGCLVSNSDLGVKLLPYTKGDTWQAYFDSTHFTSLEENLQNFISADSNTPTFHPEGNACIAEGLHDTALNNCLYDTGFTRVARTDLIKPSSEGVYYISRCK